MPSKEDGAADAASWFSQRVPLWAVAMFVAMGGGAGTIGGQWHATNTEAKTDQMITAHISQLREDQAELTAELRNAVNQLRTAIDKKVDVEAKRDLVENVMHRLDALERHIETQDDRFNNLLTSLRGGPH